MLNEFSEPRERQLGPMIAIVSWVTWLTFEELCQLDNDVAIELKVARLRLLKVLQELLQLIVRFLAEFAKWHDI